MKRARILLFWGLWVAVLPYLGFPYLWKNILFSLSGVGMIYVSFIFYKEHKKRTAGGTTFENFSENSDFSEGARNSSLN